MPESDSDNFESADEDVNDEKTEISKKLSKTNSQETKQIDEVITKTSNASSSWRSWSAFEMISSASKSVANVTTKMSQSLSTAIESINIPEPEQMAKLHIAEQNKIKKEESSVDSESSGISKFDSLLTNVGLISSKVVTGGLDTLEGIGKKTMNIIQETDPNIKGKLRSINSSNRPNLSEILKEAKNSDASSECREQNDDKILMVSFDNLLDEYNGLVNLEALNILSKQSKMKIELLLKPLTGKSLTDMEETLEEVKELCELPDCDVVNDKITMLNLEEHLVNAIADLNITLNFKDIVSYSHELNKWFEELSAKVNDPKVVCNKSIEALSMMCSLSLNNYHKLAELLLSLSHRSTADEVDAIIQLTSIYFSIFNCIATMFSDKLSTLAPREGSKKMSTEVFIECSNATTYVKKAFDAFIPLLQLGAL